MTLDPNRVKPLDLSALLRDAFLSGRGLKDGDQLSEADNAAWMDYDPERMNAYKRIVSALSTAPSGQAPLEGVKALEWEDKGDGLCRAVTPFSYSYFINARTSMWIGPEDEWLLADDPKAAAQADYETRIRSALLPASAEPVAGYCTDCESHVTIHNGRCGCGSGRVIASPPASGTVEAGWQFVPKEPTPEMLVAAEEAVDELASFAAKHDSPSYKAWRAFLSATPTEGR